MATFSVVPDLSYEDRTSGMQPESGAETVFYYYPETKGISLSGMLVENTAGTPVAGALVNLSIIGDHDCMARRTDSSGRFFFALPDHLGNRDIFLCVEDIPGIAPAILIDNDFDPRPVDLPFRVFSLSDDERATALDLAVNHKIASVFREDSLQTTRQGLRNGKPFYGDPTETLILDNYIELPTLEEYFNELPFGVKVRKEKGIKEFRFITTQVDMTIYDPLLLVDWVAVNNVERVLSMSPREIERIELVNAPYIKGEITYGGIISFVSKNNDFAGIDLPTSGTFVNYQFLGECVSFPQESSVWPGLPDARNTACWEPDIQLNRDRPTEVTFTAPATRGRYKLILRGLDMDGKEYLVTKVIHIQ
jgi:hypothetical protein